MSLNGTILLYPTKGTPPKNLDSVAKAAIDAFERLGLFVTGTAASAKKPKRVSPGILERYLRDGTLGKKDFANFHVDPEQLTPELSELVFLLDVDEEGEPGPIELPLVEFTVWNKALPMINGYDGKKLCTTWATIEFSYEDVRYNEEVHRVRDPKHPLFGELAEVFGSPVKWCVEIG